MDKYWDHITKNGYLSWLILESCILSSMIHRWCFYWSAFYGYSCSLACGCLGLVGSWVVENRTEVNCCKQGISPTIITLLTAHTNHNQRTAPCRSQLPRVEMYIMWGVKWIVIYRLIQWAQFICLEQSLLTNFWGYNCLCLVLGSGQVWLFLVKNIVMAHI